MSEFDLMVTGAVIAAALVHFAVSGAVASLIDALLIIAFTYWWM